MSKYMSKEKEIEEFRKRHSHPDEAGQESLFRFSKVPTQAEYLSALFVEGKLYHSLPSRFNDPFEAKPHFRWPSSGKGVRKIRKHLKKVARAQGKTKKEADKMVAVAIRNKEEIFASIYDAAHKTYSRARLCCFTSSKDNLLFWAHYAEGHRGFCVEYDASILPISYAFKLAYSDEYPEFEYPSPRDIRELDPLLVKSNHWAYEEEFRTILIPEADKQPDNDGESLILRGDEIIDIYFGARMENESKDLVMELLDQGPFKPKIWQAKLSPSEFKLEFNLLANSKT